MTNEELTARINAGIDVADNMLALYNQMRGIIYKTARRYVGVAELEDLTQEGYIALCAAVEGFNPAAGVKFSSYAGVCIKRHLQRYIYGNGAISIPEHMRILMGQYRQLCNAFQCGYAREPSDGETAHYLRLTGKQAALLRKAAGMNRIASLDSPIEGEEELTLCDTVAGGDCTEKEAVERVYREDVKKALWEEVGRLPGDQPEIIRRQYQDNIKPWQIAEMLGVSQDRVWNESRKGIRTLRRKRCLHAFAEEYITTHAFRHGTEWDSATERTAIGLLEQNA